MPIVTRPTEPQQNNGNKEPTKPTTPVNPTVPTNPTNPTVPANTEKPQEATQPPYKDYNQSEGTNGPSLIPQPEIVIGDAEQDHDHDGHEHGLIDEPPMVIPLTPNTGTVIPDTHDHDHEHEEIVEGLPADISTQESNHPVVTAIAVVATVAVLSGLGIWILKKKKN